MKKKKRKPKKKTSNNATQFNNMVKVCKHKHRNAIITTILTLLSIYVSFVVLLFTKDCDIEDNLYKSLSSLGGLYVNLLAVISVAYSKFSKENLVHSKVYWLSLTSFVTIISIFAQAKGMLDKSISPEWLQSPCLSAVLQILLAILIYAMVNQKVLNVRITYNKIKIIR